MEKILLDIEMAETYSTLLKHDSSATYLNMRNADSLAYYYKAIFAHHHVSIKDFQSSMVWYESHPDELDKIYADLSEKLTQLGVEYKVQ